MRSIAMLNQKGGVGKTTTTVNLAAALADSGSRVLVVDLDPQTHLGLHFGIEEGGTSVYDLLMEEDADISGAIVKARDRIDLITSEVDLAAAESELAARTDRHDLLSRTLRPVVAGYDYVFVDCPPSLGLLTINALAACQELVVPMQAHFLALQGLSRLLETVGMMVGGINPSLRVTGIVLCMHEAHTNLAREVVADLEEFFAASRGSGLPWADCRILQPAIRRNVKLAEAPSFGKTIFDYEPDCAGANDYRALAEDLANLALSPQVDESLSHEPA